MGPVHPFGQWIWGGGLGWRRLDIYPIYFPFTYGLGLKARLEGPIFPFEPLY